MMTTENSFSSDLNLVKILLYDKCSFRLTHLKWNSEGTAYGACSFELDGRKIEHRISKITPTKTGQFVTIWKRNKHGITAPFDILDDIDFVVITSKNDCNIGQFIFPKSVLAHKGIISQNGKEGKRGIRVYPSWDTVTNRQAEKAQNWQAKYFLVLKDTKSIDLDLAIRLFDPKS